MILLDYYKFINENLNNDNFVDLYLSRRFIEIMNIIHKRSSNSIANKFLNLIVNIDKGLCKDKFSVSFIDVVDGKEDTISYIVSTKAKKIIDRYSSMKKEQEGINICWLSDRQEQKIGRLINRLFPKEFNNKEIEDFVKEYKAAIASDKISDKFELIKGKDISKYYYSGSYNRESSGELQRSCMRYDHNEPFFKIYEENPDKMNMLILKDPVGNIYGRSNIWYLDEPSGKIFMDRIYTTYDWQIKLFIDYAIKNNFIYKSRQIYGGSVVPLIENGEKKKMTISVNLKPKSYKYYPYIDTMQFYNPKTGLLTSDTTKFEDKDFITLILANGEYYMPSEGYKIDYLGRIVHPYYVRWSKFDNVYVHVNDAIALNYRDDYVTPEHEFIRMGNNIYLKEDMEKDEKTGEYILKKNF